MKKKKSTKMYAESAVRNEFLLQLKAHIDDSYYLDVVYYYVRKALITLNFNLGDYGSIAINGRYFGYKDEISFSKLYNNTLSSLGLVMSIRAIMLDRDYIKNCYDDDLLFYDLDSSVITWNSHRAIMECINDDDFRQIYQMVIEYKENHLLSDEQKSIFESKTVKPKYRNAEKYYRSLASDPDYEGHAVIKNNECLCCDYPKYEISGGVEYVGDTAFAYCHNLRTLIFTHKVLFGHFPIIECNNLRQIIVPTYLIDYFKKELPYYEDIITDHEKKIDDFEEDSICEHNDSKSIIDDTEIEHVYVGVPSADPYTETEIEEETIEDEEGQTEEVSHVDFSTIERVFEKKATSYKYFWFWAILYIFYKRKQISIPYRNILAQMVAKAWKYAYVDKCNFGKVDQLKKYMDELKEMLYLQDDSKEKAVEEKILEFYDILHVDKILAPLLKNVPYRFLSPWIPFTSNEDVTKESNNPEAFCPYSIQEDCIVLNPLWLGYLRTKYNVLEEFIRRELNSYYRSIK